MLDAERKLVAVTPKYERRSERSPEGDLLPKDQLYKLPPEKVVARGRQHSHTRPSVQVLMGPPRKRGGIRRGDVTGHAGETRRLVVVQLDYH